MVPDWFQKGESKTGPSSRLAPGKLPWIFLAVALLYGLWQISLLMDWVGYAVDEGFTSHGAQRLREGQLPYRDFFFLWTPGVLFLHGLMQELGASAAMERLPSLLASAGTGAFLLAWAKRLQLAQLERLLLAGIFLLWGFSLWNVPYSSWLAIFLVVLALEPAVRGRWFVAGLVFALSFWCKQNIGLFSAAAMALWLLVHKEKAALVRFLLSLALGLALPSLVWVTFAGLGAGSQAFSQIFLFPLRYPSLMGEPLPWHLLGAPLGVMGLWALSLYFFRGSTRLQLAAQAAVLVYALLGIFREGRGFFLGSFFLLSLMAWLLAAFLHWGSQKEERRQFLFLWLPLLGSFLQVFPRWDYQHFLFSLPTAAFFLLLALRKIKLRYPWLSPSWIMAPALLLLCGGVVMQSKAMLIRAVGTFDSVGFLSAGEGHRLNEEMEAVKNFLLAEGLAPGGPILVMPNATSFYRFSGFRNPTPHDQFFPGYVEAFGAREEKVLDEFERAGGSFVVYQERSKMEKFAPGLERALRERYEPIRQFPVHFTVWKKKNAP